MGKVVGEEGSRQQKGKRMDERFYKALMAVVRPSAFTLSQVRGFEQRRGKI